MNLAKCIYFNVPCNVFERPKTSRFFFILVSMITNIYCRIIYNSEHFNFLSCVAMFHQLNFMQIHTVSSLTNFCVYLDMHVLKEYIISTVVTDLFLRLLFAVVFSWFVIYNKDVWHDCQWNNYSAELTGRWFKHLSAITKFNLENTLFI